VLAKQGVIC